MSLNILAVDDSRTMRDMVRLALGAAGMTVTTADDGVHGLEVLEGMAPDAIISDINMPRLDGFGFIRAVRAIERMRGVPILVLTTESAPELKARAREYRVPSVVYTFDPPTRVLMQGVEFLSTLPEKLDLLRLYGIDETIAVPFTPEFAARPKEAFLADLRAMKPRAVVVGEDFYFGKGRAGSTADLREVCADVVSLPMHQLGGDYIKSTRIRALLKEGDVDGAQRLLGRPYDAQGVVIHGDQLGRTIGWPTANIGVPDGKALPLGVFAVVALGDRGERWHGMANVGFRPTVNGKTRRFEVHLFDFEGNLYGKELRPGRKVGHVNAYGEDLQDCLERARHAAAWFAGELGETSE